jgi:hypothetical protein
MWHERLTDRPGVKQLVAIDEQVVGHLAIEVIQRRAGATSPISAFAWIRDGTIAALPAR